MLQQQKHLQKLHMLWYEERNKTRFSSFTMFLQLLLYPDNYILILALIQINFFKGKKNHGIYVIKPLKNNLMIQSTSL